MSSVSISLNTAVYSILQANNDPRRSHTHRVMEIKVKLKVSDMRYHFESTEEIIEIRTK